MLRFQPAVVSGSRTGSSRIDLSEAVSSACAASDVKACCDVVPTARVDVEGARLVGCPWRSGEVSSVSSLAETSSLTGTTRVSFRNKVPRMTAIMIQIAATKFGSRYG